MLIEVKKESEDMSKSLRQTEPDTVASPYN